jgi:hypothetical protein
MLCVSDFDQAAMLHQTQSLQEMGGTTSTPATVPVESGPQDPYLDQNPGGVRITVDNGKIGGAQEDRPHSEHKNGDQNSSGASFEHQFNAMAAQVYGMIDKELAEIQADSLQKSQKMVRRSQQSRFCCCGRRANANIFLCSPTN